LIGKVSPKAKNASVPRFSPLRAETEEIERTHPMSENTDAIKYLPLRAQKRAISETEAWAMLESPEINHGFLGTHGVAAEDNMPYVIPMNFAADSAARAIYLHTTIDSASKRNRAIAENPKATFVVVGPDAAMTSDGSGLACKFSMTFSSVMAFGTISAIETPAEKARILNLLMKQKAAGHTVSEVVEPHTFITTIYALNVTHISGSRK
jgi:nitroimidazol reductase NimA-like FMN-containing flavoprotein (pyridoxamine 5'-phosphate oxidase superfamily)